MSVPQLFSVEIYDYYAISQDEVTVLPMSNCSIYCLVPADC
jgi:hypothetical protein